MSRTQPNNLGCYCLRLEHSRVQGPLSEGYSVAMEQQGEGTQRDCGRVEKKKGRKICGRCRCVVVSLCGILTGYYSTHRGVQCAADSLLPVVSSCKNSLVCLIRLRYTMCFRMQSQMNKSQLKELFWQQVMSKQVGYFFLANSRCDI